MNSKLGFAKFVYILTSLGLLFELLLIEHVEAFLQLLPIIVLSLGVLIISLKLNHPILQALSLINLMVGLVGVGLHLKSNMDFALELNPALSFWELSTRSFTGALPVLAPGSLISLALIGFLIIKIDK